MSTQSVSRETSVGTPRAPDAWNRGPRIVLLADTHLGFDYPVHPRVSRRRRGQDFFDNFQRVLDYAVRTRPDLVVHGGDLFFRSRVPPKVVDLAYETIFKFGQSGIPLLIVPGNHEWSRLPASLWLGDANIHVLDRPRTVEIAASGYRIAISGFPFVRNDVRQRFGSVLAETGWEETSADIKLLCVHQAVEGARVGPSNYTFRSGGDVIKIADIPQGFAAVLAGHIHRMQILTRPQPKGELSIIYPGSIERTSFAEKDEPKGFFEIKLACDETGTWGVHEANFLELPARPMVDIDIDPHIPPAGLGAYLRGRIADLDKNAIVRLRCAGGLEGSVRAELTASSLRSVFPRSMNVQLASELYREQGVRPGRSEGRRRLRRPTHRRQSGPRINQLEV